MKIDKSVKEDVKLPEHTNREFIEANREFLLTRYFNELSDIESELDILSKIPEAEFDDDEVERQVIALREKSKEVEAKIEDIEENGVVSHNVDIFWQ